MLEPPFFFEENRGYLLGKKNGNKIKPLTLPQCLKIKEKVSFKNASHAPLIATFATFGFAQPFINLLLVVHLSLVFRRSQY